MNLEDAAFIVSGQEQNGPGWEQQEECEARRQAELVEEARRIAAGESLLRPARAHLQALISWLDGRKAENPAPSWNGEGDPF